MFCKGIFLKIEDCEGVVLYLSNYGKWPISWQGYPSCRRPLQTHVVKWATHCRKLFMETVFFFVSITVETKTPTALSPLRTAPMVIWHLGLGKASEASCWSHETHCTCGFENITAEKNCSSHNLTLTESKSTDWAVLPYWHWYYVSLHFCLEADPLWIW
jgi:hypothetical protein